MCKADKHSSKDGWSGAFISPLIDEAASTIESLSAGNAALKAQVYRADNRYDLAIASRLEWRRQAEEAQRENATLLAERNEAFERAAEAFAADAEKIMLAVVNEWHRQVGMDAVITTKLTNKIADTVATGVFRRAAEESIRNLSKES